ncbi:RHS repeat-associated core domain-containing protein [Cystobacter fuscus]|uniref:RHS repeat-associated core domain-containing protein n=1 Tax=Cystobacter fuscus TaxID=43 RepID=UPI001B7FABFA|nr:RHS repeat-associated core domain-containing protein [Cystobacter fuscus]
MGKADVALQHCPWRWPGQYEDEETGLLYNRFRYYDAYAGRYISQDPLGLAAGPSLYGYPEDPLSATDPLGLSKKPCNEVYRELSFDDRVNFDSGLGLVPKGEGGSIADHVAGKKSGHISPEATKTFSSKNGLVAIDVDKAIQLGAKFIDHGNVLNAVSKDLTSRRNAKRAEEVLFRGPIPQEAIRLIRR